MEHRAVVFDTFATEPTGGLPAAVLPEPAAGTLTDDQLLAAAGEFAAPVMAPGPPDGPAGTDAAPPGLVDSADGEWTTVDPDRADWHGPALAAAVAAGSDVDDGTHGDGDRDDGVVWTDVPAAETADAGVDPERVAGALRIDVAAVRDVGADLAPARLSAGIDAVAVPVNFLEHLGSADPDRDALRSVCADAGTDAIAAYTFDTLTGAALHLRTFVAEPAGWARTVGLELPTTPAVAGACLADLADRGTVDPTGVVEQGAFADRPGTVHVDAAGELAVGGRAVTSLRGTVELPKTDDDIVEA